MTPSPHVLALAARNDLGLAPHYLFLYSAVVGLEATTTLEFGAGGSTAVILAALQHNPVRGQHRSCSMEAQEEIAARYGIPPVHFGFDRPATCPAPLWIHRHGLSSILPEDDLASTAAYDLVLHDGSHSAEVVEADLRWALPRLRQYGLALVHDSQHSYCGAGVRAALREVLAAPLHGPAESDPIALSHTTLPYGFGLTILRRESARMGVEPLAPTRGKMGSPHRTEPCPVGPR